LWTDFRYPLDVGEKVVYLSAAMVIGVGFHHARSPKQAHLAGPSRIPTA
jgi:hypothetical protein